MPKYLLGKKCEDGKVLEALGRGGYKQAPLMSVPPSIILGSWLLKHPKKGELQN